jgi:hypothetical protein
MEMLERFMAIWNLGIAAIWYILWPFAGWW